MSTAVMEADSSVAEFAEMSAAERDTHVRGLHEQMRAEREQAAAPAETIEPPPPGRTRDEAGRFQNASKTPDSSDETPAVVDAAPAAKVESEEVPDWRDADTKGLATQYGLDEEALADIPSREVLDKVLRAIDRKAFEAAKAPPPSAAPVTPASAPATSAEQATNDALARLEAFKLDAELGADDAPKLQEAFAAVVAELKEQRAFRASLQQQQAQQGFAKLREEFATSVDSLGHTELFGKAGSRSQEQAANLEKTFAAHWDHGMALKARGGNPAPTPAFAKVAVNSLFADQLISQAKEQQLAKLKKSAARRTGGGSTTPNPLPAGATPLERNLAAATENWRKAHGG